jgi:hypothetical protein
MVTCFAIFLSLVKVTFFTVSHETAKKKKNCKAAKTAKLPLCHFCLIFKALAKNKSLLPNLSFLTGLTGSGIQGNALKNP